MCLLFMGLLERLNSRLQEFQSLLGSCHLLNSELFLALLIVRDKKFLYLIEEVSWQICYGLA
jgi:hypothetical protein